MLANEEGHAAVRDLIDRIDVDVSREGEIHLVYLEHAKAVERIVHDRGRHFDPLLVDAFLRCAPDFARIQANHRDAD